jgi:glycosyltransferase involved in cell wall biosynthesis
MTKKISILTPCYNEEAGIRECYEAVKRMAESALPGYRYEHLFIDNCSEDRTAQILREIAASDRNVKVILNSRNFGHMRSPFHGMLQATGDAVIPVLADLQTPPEVVPRLVAKWEEGFPLVLAIRKSSTGGIAMRAARSLFYRIMSGLSEIRQIPNFMGFGLYDRRVLEVFRGLGDPTGYLRGIVAEVGFRKAYVEYHQPPRLHGESRNSLATLLDMAILAMTSYSKVPLRLMTIVGLALSCVGLMVAFGYLVAKLMFWNTMELGIAPLLIGTFFFAAVQLLCIGLLGEYVSTILEHVKRRPLAIEEERINFD